MPRKTPKKSKQVDFWQEVVDKEADDLSKPRPDHAVRIARGYVATNLGSLVKRLTNAAAKAVAPYVSANLTIRYPAVERMGRIAQTKSYTVHTSIPYLLRITYATTSSFAGHRPTEYRLVFALSPALAIATIDPTLSEVIGVEVVDCDVWYVEFKIDQE